MSLHKHTSKTFVGNTPTRESTSPLLLSHKLSTNLSPSSVNSPAKSTLDRFTIVFGIPIQNRSNDNLEKLGSSSANPLNSSKQKSSIHQNPKPSPLTINKLRLKRRLSKHHEESLCKFIEDVNECEELTEEDKVEILVKQLTQYLSNMDHLLQEKKQSNKYNNNVKNSIPFKKSDIASFCSAMGIYLSGSDYLKQNELMEDSIFHQYSLLATKMEEVSNNITNDVSMGILLEQISDFLPRSNGKSVIGMLSGVFQFVSDSLSEDTTKNDIAISFHSIMKHLISMTNSKYYCSSSKKLPAKVDGLSTTFTISIDGCAESFGKTFFFCQLRSDSEEDWENLGSDLCKTLILMKSSLLHNLVNSNIAIDEVENKTKVMALLVNRSKIHLLVLDACPVKTPLVTNSEMNEDSDSILMESTIYVKNFNLYHNEFLSTDLDSILTLISMLSTRLDIYSPSCKKKHSEGEKTDFSIESSIGYQHSKTKHNLTTTFSNDTTNILFNRKVLQYLGESSNKSAMYSIACNSLLKHLTINEKYIIGLLLSHSDYSKQLPSIFFNNNTYVEMEFLENIEQDLIWDETTVCLLILDISSALRYLHKRNICHLNVTPSNVGRRGGKLSQNFICFVLQDFEYCVHFKREMYRLFDVQGQDYLKQTPSHIDPMFKAPEIDGCKYFDEKVDIYSLGTSVLFIMNPKVFTDFYEGSSSRNPQCKVSDWGPLVAKLTATMSFELRALLTAMVDPNPHDRPSAADLEGEMRQYLNSIHKSQ